MRSSTGSFTSPGSSSSLFRPSKPRKVVGLSPLATHESKATSSSPPTRRTHVDPPIAHSQREQPTTDSSQHFFEHGMGSQIMLASSGSQAKQLLLDRARRTLEQLEVEALQEKLKQVYTNMCGTVFCYKPVYQYVGHHSSVLPLIQLSHMQLAW